MIEGINFETYLFISPKKLGIYLIDKKNLKKLYNDEVEYQNTENLLDLNNLKQFLEKNIFKIEKTVGKFINNIFIIIDYYKISNLHFGIKKKIIMKL